MTSSAVLLLIALVAVVGLAKVESHPIEHAVSAVGLPDAFVGVVIAIIVLLPETLAAWRNAMRNRIRISLNLAYGSAMASIGLTIPVVAPSPRISERSSQIVASGSLRSGPGTVAA